MKDYRINVRARNNRILERIEAAGYHSQAEFCRAFGVSTKEMAALITMRKPAQKKDGSWREIVQQIADALRCTPGDLFNARQASAEFNTTTGEIKTDDPILSLETCRNEPSLLPSPEESLMGQELAEMALRDLPVREATAISLRYGINGASEHTLHEIGEVLGVTEERVRQICSKAEGRLREKYIHAA